MLPIKDLYTANKLERLSFFEGQAQSICETSYEVRLIQDPRNLEVTKSYLVKCRTRVRVGGSGIEHLSPNSGDGFKDYPLMLRIACSLDADSQNVGRMLRYSPKTVNTGVQLSSGENTSSSSSFVQQHSVGSSTSSTNGYNVEASAGFMLDMPTASVGGGYNHSKTNELSVGDVGSSETSRSTVTSSGAGMSIKDWGGYASPDPGSCRINWVFGQEYPWNAVRDRFTWEKSTNPKIQIALPKNVKNRLFDLSGNQAIPYPPSELSLFGIDFSTEVDWLIPADQCSDKLSLTHEIGYVRGSHYSAEIDAVVEMDAEPSILTFQSDPLDLVLLALDPITFASSEPNAVIGFLRPQFIVPPAPGSVASIVSSGNNLYVSATGFGLPMKALVSKESPAIINIQFKIVDPFATPFLNIKHWKSSEVGCCLELIFNNSSDSRQIYYVDSKEGEGGMDNTLAIQLRNSNVDSLDFHDYLKLGLNTIQIRVTPIGENQSSQYEIRALSISQ